MQKKMKIAIDGPAGAGKSTVAKKIADKLGLLYLDTGSMYRAVTLKAIMLNSSFDEKSLVAVAEDIYIDVIYDKNKVKVFLDGEDVTEEIRLPRVTERVSIVASIPEVRENMLKRQQDIARRDGVIMDGRDIGTRVMKDADYKFFLTASIKERARRRLIDLKKQGYEMNLQDVIAEISKRDEMDKNRPVAPLKPAEDAVVIDSTDLTAEQVVDKIMGYINRTN